MNTFIYINKKHGRKVIKTLRTYESLKTKLMKVEAVIRFIKSCKKTLNFNICERKAGYKKW